MTDVMLVQNWYKIALPEDKLKSAAYLACLIRKIFLDNFRQILKNLI